MILKLAPFYEATYSFKRPPTVMLMGSFAWLSFIESIHSVEKINAESRGHGMVLYSPPYCLNFENLRVAEDPTLDENVVRIIGQHGEQQTLKVASAGILKLLSSVSPA